MKVEEARTDGKNYQLHVHRSVDGEVLSDDNINNAMKDSGISGSHVITGWKGIHFVVTTSNCPSIDQVRLFCQKIKETPPIIL
jgi:hypothetical protein